MAGRLRDQFAALERAMRDWELVDSDRFSFEDSDRFEEDSLCSWISEPESLCNNWRGWKKSTFTPNGNPVQNNLNGSAGKDCGTAGGSLSHAPSSSNLKKMDYPAALSGLSSSSSQLSLVELAAKLVASHIPFEMVERFYPPVPEQLQLRIAFWSFPEHEEDIRLYSCLANGSAEEFQKGERLFRNDSVSDILQIGFHLSATVKPNMREAHKVAVTFDRRRVTSCTCTCNASTNWCGHVVAVCLHRIFQSKDVMLRAPVSESLSRLHRDQLQKFAQYLISELPQQILPTAQRLLDELLSSQRSAINTLRGAPDPTAGASANEQTTWYLDERTLHGNIHKILIKFCVPAPIVFSDVNYLSSAAPPASAEWSSLLRPLRGREPEGMWNLLSIVREMFRREDRNAIPLLEVITEECLNCDQILVWWFNTKVALHNGSSGHGGKHHSVNSNAHACQHAGASLCDEIVLLWRLAALNPGVSPDERCILHSQFKEWHLKIIEKVSKSRNASVGSKHANSFKNDVEVFPGFKPAMEACYLNWDNYPIPGVTYSESNLVYHCPFMCFRHSDGHSRSGDTGMIHSSHAVLNNPIGEHHLLHSSATISSIPLGSKRPRSVEFGGEKNSSSNPSSSSGSGNATAGTSTSAAAAGSSTSKSSGKSGKNGKKQRDRERETALPPNVEVMESFSPVLPVGASGLKIKSTRQPSLEQSSSFDDEVPGSSGTCGQHGNNRNQRRVSPDVTPSGSGGEIAEGSDTGAGGGAGARRDGNRSSVSSEGFCENDVEIDSELLKDEGVELVESKIVAQKPGGKNNGSDEQENEVDADLDADSDSSASARACAVLVPAGPPKFDSSDSQQSGDEYQLYYYDAKSSVGANKRDNAGKNNDENSKKDNNLLGFNVVANLKRIEDPWEILFARAEGLHAHGHSKDACVLGVKLADELLANPPDLTLEPPAAPTGKGKKRKVNPASHQISCLASATLAKCGFLCTVLAENPEYYYLAFQVGMFGLELARPPASTKPLEVKLANQEAELALLLKRIAIGAKELSMIREKAEQLRDGKFKSRGDALLPLVLANFIFDALVMPTNREGRCVLQPGVYHLPTDEMLGFEAAVAALGLKANVSEAEHPLLCEGTRRQRGDLALSMLLHYKDDPEKLAKVMDKLLNREIHQLYKAPLPAAYYSNNPPTTTLLGSNWTNRNENSEREMSPPVPGFTGGLHNLSNGAATGSSPNSSPPPVTANPSVNVVPESSNNTNKSSETENESPSNSLAVEVDSLANLLRTASVGSKGGSSSKVASSSSSSSNSNSTSSTSPGGNGSSSPLASSPPIGATASSANNTAGNSITANNATAVPVAGTASTSTSSATTGNGPGGKSGRESGRFKGKRNYPVLPNQPSEAGAHFMFELAKIVLGKAGGSSNQSLFTQPSNGQNPRGPHRALHMCAFHIGLYALGLHNAVSPNWLSRTYSSHVSWITGQAMEIGAPAIAFLIDTWDSHLTPPEAVTIADRASRGDVNMVRAAAELALSCLPYAHALNPNEIHRAILQCKEQSDGMLEKACITVESAAKGGGVYPEVLFDVARQWYSLYQKHLPLDADILNEELNHPDSLLSLDGSMDSMNGQVSIQTGLPHVNPNNPPPPPTVSSSGPTGPNPMEMMGMPPPGPPLSHSHQPVYPIATHQVPMASIPYAAAPYGQVPFIPATFSPVQGNFVYGQTVIYQASASSNPAVTTASGYFNQAAQQNQAQPGNFGGVPPMHQQPIHNMVSAGPALQYYPSVTSITSAGLRPTAQFFPVSHMSLHPAHANSLNSIPPQSGSNVAAVMAATGGHSHVQHPHGHALNMAGQGHLVAISSGAPGNGPSMAMANGHNPHGVSHPHNMSINGGRPPMQPQVSCGSTLMSHNGNNFMQGGPLPSQPQNAPQHLPGGVGNGAVNMDGTVASGSCASQGRGSIFAQGGRDHSNQQGGTASAVKLKYLLAAYRVGMLAMETLARRVHDDRPAAKFARNPPYGEDVKWLLGISRKLGAQYLQQFCICAVSSIANPFVLHEIILDAALISTRNNLAWVYQNPRSPLAPLVQKCQQMYFQCLHQKLYHITLSDYEDFVNIVCTARQAFHITPDGISQFKEWLQNLRRSKACKKDLWAQITAALQANQK